MKVNVYDKVKSMDQYICTQCKSDKGTQKKFSAENFMVPSVVPPELRDLTQCEEMLIARAFPIMQVYTKAAGGQLGYKGHIINLPNDVKHIANVLPHYPKDIPVVTFRVHLDSNQKAKAFRVRRQRVLNELNWLVRHNSLYKDVVIDESRLQYLPVDDFLCVPIVDSNDVDPVDTDLGPPSETNDLKGNVDNSSFLPLNPSFNRKENEKITGLFSGRIENMNVQGDPFNEYSTQFLASLAFPTLFPNCSGDPTNNSLVRDIARNENEAFAKKVKHLMKFAELIDGKWHYRFASHPRFGYWAYDMLYRHRILGQGNFFINNDSLARSLQLEELREMLRSGSYHGLMKSMMHYAKNITGSNAYWHQVKQNLKATVTQVGAPTIFFTLSYAEFHWPELHSLFTETDILTFTSEDIRENVVSNPHILDWFFVQSLLLSTGCIKH